MATETLTPGETKTGSIPGTNPGHRLLSETQYTVQYPGGGAKLALDFRPDYPVNFYVRRNLPVTMEGNSVIYDFGPFKYQKFSLPSSPPLDAATYFIAVENYSSSAVTFTLTASLVDPTTGDTVDLSFPSIDPLDRLEVGSILAPEPNGCLLGRTQYTISVADSMYCSWASGWFASLRSDQNLNLYARSGQRVAVENGKVVADFESKPPKGDGHFFVFSSVSPKPLVRTFFIAVENCNPNATNYALTFKSQVPEFPAPSITAAFFVKKNLHVMGYFLSPSSTVLFDGEPQETKYGGPSGGSIAEDILIVKRARKKINAGESVTISVKTPSGCITRPFPYVRPGD